MIPLRDEHETRIFPTFTYAFIGINVVVWFLSFANRDMWNLEFGLIPWELVTGQRLPDSQILGGVASLFTSMFMHGGFMHAAGNMLYLYVFGDNIEERFSGLWFVAFYVVTGLAAALAQVASLYSRVAPPVAPVALEAIFTGRYTAPDAIWFIPTVGASGAISGVMGAYLVLFPRTRVLTLIPLGFFTRTVHLPAQLLIGLWFGMQLLSGLSGGSGLGGVAWWAHIGGFIAGALLALVARGMGNPMRGAGF